VSALLGDGSAGCPASRPRAASIRTHLGLEVRGLRIRPGFASLRPTRPRKPEGTELNRYFTLFSRAVTARMQGVAEIAKVI
jgi:hypothetical protein